LQTGGGTALGTFHTYANVKEGKPKGPRERKAILRGDLGKIKKNLSGEGKAGGGEHGGELSVVQKPGEKGKGIPCQEQRNCRKKLEGGVGEKRRAGERVEAE